MQHTEPRHFTAGSIVAGCHAFSSRYFPNDVVLHGEVASLTSDPLLFSVGLKIRNDIVTLVMASGV